ncbi:MAG TPA: FGGY family carbohydrate kinase [Terracidiphilus sp.]|nr:FGGY family carbohydrate kinase [Terracidiphilus sp.]
MQEPARIAIDLGAESCRVSLLRWIDDQPSIEVVHRIPNGPVHHAKTLHWPLETILAGLEEGLRKSAQIATEGIASIAVDSWSVDYVRLAPGGLPLRQPFCYRDERTEPVKEATDKIIPPRELFARTGVLPHRINTVYQLLADQAAGIDPHAPWVMMPEYVLYWLGGRRVAEHTNATHTGLVDLKTGDWDAGLFQLLGLSLDAAPPIVPAGTILDRLQGPLASLDAFRNTVLIAPACHDTASAIAGIPSSLDSTLYICSGTWSLVGTLITEPVTSSEAFDARYTNLGAAGGGLCFHSLVNGMWLLKQCMDAWAAEGRPWNIEELIAQATQSGFPGIIDVDAEPLLLDSEMPERINHQLWRRRWATIPDVAGNEPVFARVIFESLADRYAYALDSLEKLLGRQFDRIHILGGASRNKLLTELTQQRTHRPIEIGHPESSTLGNFAVQLAASGAGGQPVTADAIRKWAALLSQC